MQADHHPDALERDLTAIFSANAQVAKPSRRVSGTAIATAAVLVLAAGGGLLLWSPWEGAEHPPVLAEKAPPRRLPPAPVQKKAARDLFADQEIERPTLAPREPGRHKHKAPQTEPTPPIVVAAMPAPERPVLAPTPVPEGPSDEEKARLEAERARAARIDALDAIRTLRLR